MELSGLKVKIEGELQAAKEELASHRMRVLQALWERKGVGLNSSE